MPQLLRNLISADAIDQLEQGPSCLTKFPEFAAAVAETIGFGAHIEHAQAMILSTMLSNDRDAAMAMYLSQVGGEARRKLLFTVADVCIFTDEDKRQTFNLVMRVLKAVRGQRNAFAHGIWGFTPALPDAVLLVDIESLANQHMRLLRGDFKDLFGTQYTYVYRQQDFADAVENARQASNAAFVLRSYLGEADTAKRAALKNSLMQMSLVQGLVQPD